jgi:hypothetical protein
MTHIEYNGNNTSIAPGKLGAILVEGDIAVPGSADGSETSGDVVAGIVVYDMTHIEYTGNNTSIAPGKFGDILVEGDIAVPVSADVSDLTEIVEGGKVFIGSDGKVATQTGTLKEIPSLRFLGITETVDGVNLTAVRKRMF